MSFQGKKAVVNSSKVGNLQPCPNASQVALAPYQFNQGFSDAHIELPRDIFPAVSLAVPAAIEIPIVPFPVILEIVTVLVDVPDPVTFTVPVAVPVVFRVMSPLSNVTESAPV